MNARAWIGAFVVALGLHAGLAIALLAVDARATAPASLHDDGGIDIGLGSVEIAAANASAPEATPAVAPPPRVQSRVADPAPVAPEISAVTPSEPPAPDAVVVASAPEPVPAPPASTPAPTATTVAATASTTAVTSTGDTSGDAGTTAGVTGAAQRGGQASYFGKLKAWLNQHKKYPVAAKKEKQQGTVTVTFTIDRNGRLLASRVEKSSGNGVLDNAALELLRRASPMPRIPDTMPQAQLVVTLPVEYSLITR